jgi:replicative DNA helicase
VSYELDDTTSWPAHLNEERYTLGACLCGQAVEAVQLLQADDFSLSAHQKIFGAICSLVTRGETALDFPLLEVELHRRGQLKEVGGLAYLLDLAVGIVTARPMASRVRILREFADRRRLLKISAEVERLTRDLSNPVSEIKAWLREVGQ